jgi:4,5:9,10-diseco-3-hydroxy-5,9,17-trioxoandrosta-1(10),2-diene-4-oate hydrolase
MNDVAQLGYLGFEVKDLAAWERFGADVLGLDVVERQRDGAFGLRMDGHAQRFFITPGPADDLAVLGWQAADDDAFDRLVTRLRAAGVDVVDATPEERARRGVARLAKYADPGGIPSELFTGPALAATPFQSRVVPRGFVADGQGLGHLVVSARAQAESQRFYCDVLGLRLSDHIRCEVHGYKVDIAFLHANERHHSVAFGDAQRKRLHHFMLEVKSMDDVGLGFDRTLKSGLRIMQTLGRHPNDGMFSFYAKTPSGFQFELGWGGRQIDDATWTPTTYDRISEWGHHPPEIPSSRSLQSQGTRQLGHSGSAPLAVDRAAPRGDDDTTNDRGAPDAARGEPRMNTHVAVPEGSYADIGEGLRIHYHEAGRHHGGTPVVFLHGSGPGASGWSNFRRNFPFLVDNGFHVLLPDTLGFGYSSKPDLDYDLNFVVGGLERFLKAVGVERCVVVGNSHGGAMATRLALSRPDLVTKLVLMAPGGLEDRETYMKMDGIRTMMKVFLGPSGITREGMEQVFRLQMYDATQVTADIIDERLAIAPLQPKRVLTTLNVPNLAPELSRLACPVLGFWGSDDKFCPQSGAATLARECKDARVMLLSRCGHWVMVEKTELFNRTLLSFLQEEPRAA